MPLEMNIRDKILNLAKPYPRRAKQATEATSLKAEVQHLPARYCDIVVND
jgi:hypothetical protein